jgi:hypothetical protein
MRISTTGRCAYGYGPTVAIDGTTPAALVGQFCGVPGGPPWLSTTKIAYQNGGTGAGPWIVQSYDTGTLATAELSSTGANRVGAGASIWAKWLSGAGVTSSNGVTLPNAVLADVSSLGQIVVVDNYAAGTGITVYSPAAAVALALPGVVLINNQGLRLVGNALAYQDTTGWKLVGVGIDDPLFAPRINETVVNCVPVLMADGSYCVVETSNSRLTVRSASTGTGFVVEDAPDAFWADAIQISPGVVRVGFCTNQGESADSAVRVDVTMATGANIRSTVVAGAFVPVVQTPFAKTTFDVGPTTGSAFQGGDRRYTPFIEPVDKHGGLMTEPWKKWVLSITGDSASHGGAIAKIPPPVPPSPSFGTILVPGQPPIVAFGPNDTATVNPIQGLSGTTDPITRTLTLKGSAASGGGGSVGRRGLQGERGRMGPPNQPWWAPPPYVVTIANADILTLPTAAVTLVPGIPGMRLVPIGVDLQFRLLQDYTNINADVSLDVRLDTHVGILSAPFNDSGLSVTKCSDFFLRAPVDHRIWLPPYEPVTVSGAAGFINPEFRSAFEGGLAMTFKMDNGANMDLTGGDGGNYMIATSFYYLVPSLA